MLQYILFSVKEYILLKNIEIPSHPHVCFRLAGDEKQRFQEAARQDGKALGTWLKALARQRITEMESDKQLRRQCRQHNNGKF